MIGPFLQASGNLSRSSSTGHVEGDLLCSIRWVTPSSLGIRGCGKRNPQRSKHTQRNRERGLYQKGKKYTEKYMIQKKLHIWVTDPSFRWTTQMLRNIKIKGKHSTDGSVALEPQSHTNAQGSIPRHTSCLASHWPVVRSSKTKGGSTRGPCLYQALQAWPLKKCLLVCPQHAWY